MKNRSATRKKHFERFLLEHFLRVSRTTAEVVDDTGEAPDLVVRTNGRLVGVEVTELFRDSGDDSNAQQAQEEIAQRIATRAQEVYALRGAPHAHVSIHFSPNGDLRRLNRERTAVQLAAFVEERALAAWQRCDWRQDHVSKALPDEISCLDMLGVPEAGMSLWTTPRGGWVAPLDLQTIQRRVDEKATRLERYRERVATNWLLLVSDGARPSQFFEPPTPDVARAVVSPFDRSFFFARFREVVVELGDRAQ